MSEQSMTALAAANRKRHRQTTIKHQLEAGDPLTATLLTDPALTRKPLDTVLQWVPGIGALRAEQIMQAADTHGLRACGQLTDRQRTVIERECWRLRPLTTEERQVIADLELTSHGAVSAYVPIASKGAYGSSSPAPRPDIPHLRHRAAILNAGSPEERAQALTEARAELEAIRHPGRNTHATAIRPLHRDPDLLRDARDLTAREVVATREFRHLTVRQVVQKRTQAGLDPATGRPFPAELDKAEHAHRLAEQGMGERNIAAQLGVSKSTVRRLLGKAA